MGLEGGLSSMTAIVLAGGKATRMGGRNKAFLKVDGKPIIENLLDKFKGLFGDILIVANDPAPFNQLPITNYQNTKIVSDIIPEKGPLGGIYTGLMTSRAKFNFVIACDMPFIDIGLIRYMYERADEYDVVVPKVDDRYEPLFAIYSKKCAQHIKRLIDEGILRVRDFFPKVKVREILREEIACFIVPEKIFINLNKPEDVQRLS